jgi:peptidyl-tRNA hydrolase
MQAITDYRLYLIVREDLDMPVGKAMGQAAHAAEGTLVRSQLLAPELTGHYLDGASRKKIVLRVKSLPKLLAVQAKAVEAGLVHHLVTDAAHTVFTEPTITCLGIGPVGPADSAKLQLVLKGLQLYA